jgi:hypothetical protein
MRGNRIDLLGGLLAFSVVVTDAQLYWSSTTISLVPYQYNKFIYSTLVHPGGNQSPFYFFKISYFASLKSPAICANELLVDL